MFVFASGQENKIPFCLVDRSRDNGDGRMEPSSGDERISSKMLILSVLNPERISFKMVILSVSNAM